MTGRLNTWLNYQTPWQYVLNHRWPKLEIWLLALLRSVEQLVFIGKDYWESKQVAIKSIIIHFCVSDWLKSHAQFIVTSYCRLNLEEFCDIWTDKVNRAAELPDYWTFNWEDLGMRLSCFWQWVQNAGTFHLFHEEWVGILLSRHSKNSKKTTRRMTSAIWRIFAELKNPYPPFFHIFVIFFHDAPVITTTDRPKKEIISLKNCK